MAEGIKYLQNEEVEAIFSCDYTNWSLDFHKDSHRHDGGG
jgi:hypothetical protein